MFTPISHDKDAQYLELAFLLSNAPVLYYLEIPIEWGAITLAVRLPEQSLNSVAPQLAPEERNRGLNRSNKKHSQRARR